MDAGVRRKMDIRAFKITRMIFIEELLCKKKMEQNDEI